MLIFTLLLGLIVLISTGANGENLPVHPLNCHSCTPNITHPVAGTNSSLWLRGPTGDCSKALNPMREGGVWKKSVFHSRIDLGKEYLGCRNFPELIGASDPSVTCHNIMVVGKCLQGYCLSCRALCNSVLRETLCGR